MRLNDIKRLIQLGYDPEASCIHYDHDNCFWERAEYRLIDNERDFSLMNAIYRINVGLRVSSMINVLNFIKCHSKRPVIMIDPLDTNIFYPREDYLILRPRGLNWHCVKAFTFCNPILKFCVENEFIIVKSTFIQTNLVFFGHEIMTNKCRCNHEARIRQLCENCQNYKYLIEFRDIVANLTRKQTTLFELLLNKLHF